MWPAHIGSLAQGSHSSPEQTLYVSCISREAISLRARLSYSWLWWRHDGICPWESSRACHDLCWGGPDTCPNLAAILSTHSSESNAWWDAEAVQAFRISQKSKHSLFLAKFPSEYLLSLVEDLPHNFLLWVRITHPSCAVDKRVYIWCHMAEYLPVQAVPISPDEQIFLDCYYRCHSWSENAQCARLYAAHWSTRILRFLLWIFPGIPMRRFDSLALQWIFASDPLQTMPWMLCSERALLHLSMM